MLYKSHLGPKITKELQMRKAFGVEDQHGILVKSGLFWLYRCQRHLDRKVTLERSANTDRQVFCFLFHFPRSTPNNGTSSLYMGIYSFKLNGYVNIGKKFYALNQELFFDLINDKNFQYVRRNSYLSNRCNKNIFSYMTKAIDYFI